MVYSGSVKYVARTVRTSFAGVAHGLSTCLPSRLNGFESRRPLQNWLVYSGHVASDDVGSMPKPEGCRQGTGERTSLDPSHEFTPGSSNG